MTIIEWNQSFIIAAYAVTWVVLIGYMVRLARKGFRVRGDYDRIVAGQAEEGSR